MSQVTINNGDSGLVVRTALNNMFTELYGESNFPQVANYAALPAAASFSGQTYEVLASSGTWITATKKAAGLYRSNGTVWLWLGDTVSTAGDISNVAAGGITSTDVQSALNELDTKKGSVASVAVTTANGVSGTVANSTTTAAISLTLGAITPSSVAASGAVSGSNLSGTNTGDETSGTVVSKLSGQAITPASVAATGAITSSGGTGIGYATGAGSAVTQATSKATAVTINTLSGQITTNNAALLNAAAVNFTVNNSKIAATDSIMLSLASGNTANAYLYSISGVASGSFSILLYNRTGGSLSETLVFNFVVIKGVAA